MYDGSASDSVYYAALSGGGSIGNWVLMDDALPQGVMGASSVVVGNEIFVIGGHNGTSRLTTVYSATITEPGETADGWNLTDAALPTAVEQGDAIVYGGETYVFGGFAISGPQTAVYSTDFVPEFDGGNGSEGTPYQISTCEQLQGIQDDLTAHYRLVSNVDCSMTHPEDGDFDENGRWGDGTGFEPIGNAENPFSGTLDGDNKIITGLYINRGESDNVGLFGNIKNTTLASVNFDGADITGNNNVGVVAGGTVDDPETSSNITDIYVSDSFATGTSRVGGIFGSTYGSNTIVNSYVNAQISGDNNLGGFIGRAAGSEITGSLADSSVSSDSEEAYDIGGFVGNAGCGTSFGITEAWGDVEAELAENVGGFVGHDECLGPGSNFTRVAASGDVTGDESVGGFAGYARDSTFDRTAAIGDVAGNDTVGGFGGRLTGYDEGESMAGTVDRSYSLGSVDGGDATGGFAGSSLGVHYTDSYTRSNVQASVAPGGFIGTVEEAESSQPTTLTNVYAANTVDAGVYPKGLIGRNFSDYLTVTNSFWDDDLAMVDPSDLGTPKTTSQMKSVNTFTSQLGDEAWDFEDTWGFGEGLNNGYPCLQWSTQDSSCASAEPTVGDSDGISDAVENAAPNNGDANNDGTPDSEQANVASMVDPISGNYAVLVVDEPCSIQSLSIAAESANSSQDSDFSYPAGMMDFTLNCGENGVTATVTQYYYGASGTFVVRKFNGTSYVTIDGASTSDQAIAGQQVKVASYQVKDGGSLDLDGQENGSIHDPAGLAQANSAATESGSLSGTGQNILAYIILATTTCGVATLALVHGRKRRYRL